ncbi:putative glycoside hydrolase/deacetylase ChbG (UPF0249 family) [Fontibacillus solani]|uniref:Putative glycoside hydrolase/deacetylase ChbG (UPF0249 family) n=1 Tax=Fontibacillus solani TaxID=1572857 RepID=A0A7W3ST02_9BACL|nr:ChbG/HpnK family deacetylase [Fontibacillus solani]MBA9085630.1 putative glycoside hydrolase/deacetylase ChbG (UPF0249 family) [Fontibacillus solani]
MSKYLIINGDDFGMNEAVNRGIVEAHAAGTLSSTSLLVNMAAFKQAIQLARQLPTLGVGLHFNLTEGMSISSAEQIPSLVYTDGLFSGNRKQWVNKEIECELSNQYNKMVSAGIQPTHIDTHHHIHMEMPMVYIVMKRFAQRLNIPLRLNLKLKRIINQSSSTEHLILDTYGKPDGITRMLSHLEEIQSGTTEIMTHPGYPEKPVKSLKPEQDWRSNEFLVLTNDLINDAIREHGIQLIHYGQLAKVRVDHQEKVMEEDPIKIIDIPLVEDSVQYKDLSTEDGIGQNIIYTRVSHKKTRYRNKKRKRIKKNKNVRRKRNSRVGHSKRR